VPVDGSHWLSMREILHGLSQKGHEIVVVAPEINLQIKPTKTFVMKMFPVPFTQEELDENFQAFSNEITDEGSLLERTVRFYQRSKKTFEFYTSTCRHLLFNKDLVRYLEESKF
ncbi:UD11 glucuronosyltransferase, partial [Crotophaga sulcirostris]|nr:UD11 glucuronosyltransferase [Crotophaga sulcirostris]